MFFFCVLLTVIINKVLYIVDFKWAFVEGGKDFYWEGKSLFGDMKI